MSTEKTDSAPDEQSKKPMMAESGLPAGEKMVEAMADNEYQRLLAHYRIDDDLMGMESDQAQAYPSLKYRVTKLIRQGRLVIGPTGQAEYQCQNDASVLKGKIALRIRTGRTITSADNISAKKEGERALTMAMSLTDIVNVATMKGLVGEDAKAINDMTNLLLT